MNKLIIPIPILVEGKYDKILLSSVLDATIYTTDGFGIFKQSEKAALLRRIARERGLIILTDPDSGGGVIRSHLRSILPKEGVIHLYIPPVKGKEKRKEHPSKQGILGVEGTDADRIRELFLPFAQNSAEICEGTAASCSRSDPPCVPLTKADLYADGFSGGANAAERRASLCAALSLPPDLSANALLEAINLLSLGDRYRIFVSDRKDIE